MNYFKNTLEFPKRFEKLLTQCICLAPDENNPENTKEICTCKKPMTGEELMQSFSGINEDLFGKN